MGAHTSTRHATIGILPHILTRVYEKGILLAYLNLEFVRQPFESKEAYVSIFWLQELHDGFIVYLKTFH